MQDAAPIRCFVVYATGRGLFRWADTLLSYDALAPGAMWYADWYRRKGPDGHHLIVRTPGGDWHIDGRASNCTQPHDTTHFCWVRHGDIPTITVNKQGPSCGCGHSIVLNSTTRRYHGVLTDGYLIAV